MTETVFSGIIFTLALAFVWSMFHVICVCVFLKLWHICGCISPFIMAVGQLVQLVGGGRDLSAATRRLVNTVHARMERAQTV